MNIPESSETVQENNYFIAYTATMTILKEKKIRSNQKKLPISRASITDETQKLIEKITESFNADEQIPSISELETQVPASRVTIISALNRLVSSGVIYAVHGKGYYKSGSTHVKTKNIGLLINNMNFSHTPELSNTLMLPYMLGIQETLSSARFKILPFPPQQLLSSYSLAELCSYDGLVYMYSSYQDNSFMYSITVPFVVIGGPSAHKGIPVIRTDFPATVEACLAHFYTCGHRRIAFICYEEYPHHQSALDEIYRRYGMSVHAIPVIDQSTLQLDLSRMHNFFEIDCDITAVLASDKQTADYFLNQCALRGATVPGSFSLAALSYPPEGKNIFDLKICGGSETEALLAAGKQAGIIFCRLFSGKNNIGSVHMITPPFKEGNSVKNVLTKKKNGGNVCFTKII